jgi:DNA-binding MarR family transcriptional regulator
MSIANLSELERRILERLEEYGPLRIKGEDILDVVESLGVDRKDFTEARDTLRGLQLVTQTSDEFTSGAVVLEITPAGRSFLKTKPS